MKEKFGDSVFKILLGNKQADQLAKKARALWLIPYIHELRDSHVFAYLKSQEILCFPIMVIIFMPYYIRCILPSGY